MFGGHGIYADELFFALESAGEIFLKTDAETEPAFAAAGSLPFSFERAGKTTVTSYRRIPEAALDDPDEPVRWCCLALGAAQRASLPKQAARGSAQRITRPRVARREGRARAKPR
jgi:DNA transformation protein and related proteins